MFEQRFLTSKVGLAALASVASMVAFNLYALTLQSGVASDLLLVTASAVPLA